MVQNLSARNCALLGIHAVPDLEAQRHRFRSNGWDGSEAADMLAVYEELPASEKVSCLRDTTLREIGGLGRAMASSLGLGFALMQCACVCASGAHIEVGNVRRG